MGQSTLSRIWIIIGSGCLVVAGFLTLWTIISREPSPPPPTPTLVVPTATSSPTPLPTQTPTPIPTATPDPIVAHVNEYTITYSLWYEATILDYVASDLAGQETPQSDQVLQRLISESLIQQSFPPEQEPTEEEIEERISAMEQAWGIEDADLVAKLEAVGLDRDAFYQAIYRVMLVQAGLKELEKQDENLASWLQEQRETAEITTVEGVPTPAIPTTQSPTETQVSPTTTPTPDASSAIPEVAPEFVLQRATGGTFTLTKQLAEGPVVLVFFQKCG